jgi:UDP-N-acetylglucosamine 2-epimerase
VPAKTLVVIGSRPEAIKLAPVIRVLRQQSGSFEAIICNTGQQRDMVPPALHEFGLHGDVDLDVMQPDQTLAGLTARLSQQLDRTIETLSPDWILVQGDTTSAMVGALTGFYRRVPVGHVEAGMRTGNIHSPFPEEVNRRIITQCATLHFAPTAGCEANLLREGIPPSQVLVTGNTVVDALLLMRERIRRTPSRLSPELHRAIEGRRLILLTMHRRESFSGGLARICEAIGEIARRVADAVIVLPVHPNPTVRRVVERHLRHRDRVLLVEPLAYHPFLELMDRSYLVMTDSGGLQEEAPSFGKPTLVLRDTTERPEGVEARIARLVGTDTRAIIGTALELLESEEAYRSMADAPNPYGDGAAARRIVASLTRGAERPAAGPPRPAGIARLKRRHDPAIPFSVKSH